MAPRGVSDKQLLRGNDEQVFMLHCDNVNQYLDVTIVTSAFWRISCQMFILLHNSVIYISYVFIYICVNYTNYEI